MIIIGFRLYFNARPFLKTAMDFLDFEDEDIPAVSYVLETGIGHDTNEGTQLPEYSDRPAPPAKRSAAPIGAESETAKDKDKEDGQLNLTLDSDYENDDPADKAGAEGQDKPRVVRKPRVVVKLDAERCVASFKELQGKLFIV